MGQSKFDLVMDYIDEHVREDNNMIKKAIYGLIGINSHKFGEYFTFQTGDTLTSYIRNRRLYFAAMELLRSPNKSICEIALEFGYSEQSAFTRAITTTYNVSPNEIRTSCYVDIPNEKYLLADFDSNPSDTRTARIWREFERTGYISSPNLDFLEDIHQHQKELPFDIDTCYAIADLADRLEVPVGALMHSCLDLMIEVQSDHSYIPEKEMVAMELGIRSSSELNEICEHYNCKYYDLNSWMVQNYYSKQR